MPNTRKYAQGLKWNPPDNENPVPERSAHETAHECDECRALKRSLANVDAAIWGGLKMINAGREAQGLSLIRSCLPDDYEPYGR